VTSQNPHVGVQGFSSEEVCCVFYIHPPQYSVDWSEIQDENKNFGKVF
jgi:hypothetical protein